MCILRIEIISPVVYSIGMKNKHPRHTERRITMSKSRTAPYYLTKREIVAMNSPDLVNAFEIAVTDLTIAQNCRSRIPAKLAQQLDWIRAELLARLTRDVQ